MYGKRQHQEPSVDGAKLANTSWVLREWHEVRPNACCMTWALAGVGSRHASPVGMGLHLLIVQAVI